MSLPGSSVFSVLLVISVSTFCLGEWEYLFWGDFKGIPINQFSRKSINLSWLEKLFSMEDEHGI